MLGDGPASVALPVETPEFVVDLDGDGLSGTQDPIEEIPRTDTEVDTETGSGWRTGSVSIRTPPFATWTATPTSAMTTGDGRQGAPAGTKASALVKETAAPSATGVSEAGVAKRRGVWMVWGVVILAAVLVAW